MTLGNNLSALTLFEKMDKTDQKHAIAVLQTIRNWGELNSSLLQAALLHDVGKSLGQPLFHRVLIVLLATFMPKILHKFGNASLNCVAWRRPFVIHAKHHEIGATWAREAGCDELVVCLIRHHQQKPVINSDIQFEKFQAILYQADSIN